MFSALKKEGGGSSPLTLSIIPSALKRTPASRSMINKVQYCQRHWQCNIISKSHGACNLVLVLEISFVALRLWLKEWALCRSFYFFLTRCDNILSGNRFFCCCFGLFLLSLFFFTPFVVHTLYHIFITSCAVKTSYYNHAFVSCGDQLRHQWGFFKGVCYHLLSLIYQPLFVHRR